MTSLLLIKNTSCRKSSSLKLRVVVIVHEPLGLLAGDIFIARKHGPPLKTFPITVLCREVYIKTATLTCLYNCMSLRLIKSTGSVTFAWFSSFTNQYYGFCQTPRIWKALCHYPHPLLLSFRCYLAAGTFNGSPFPETRLHLLLSKRTSS